MSSFLNFFIEEEKDLYMEAYNAEKDGNFLKAAEIYAEMATAEIDNNIYSFVRYSGLAALSYLKAEKKDLAERQLIHTLETYDESKNLSRTTFQPQYLLSLVWELFEQDFIEEAKNFLSQINKKLAENECPFKIDFIQPKLLNVECPSCQAMTSVPLSKDSKCLYCDADIF